MLAWNGMGIAFGVLALMIGWKRWLKVAPWAALCWAALAVWSVAFPMFEGSSGWVRLGLVTVNAWDMIILVAPLFVAWAVRKYAKLALALAAVATLLAYGMVAGQVPLVSFGGTLTVCAWMLTGVCAAAIKD